MNRTSSKMTFGLCALLGMFQIAAVSGCTYLQQTREDVQPVAVLSMRTAQTLNPDASKNRKVVVGQDGRASAKVSEAYVKSFESNSTKQKATEAFQGTSTDN